MLKVDADGGDRLAVVVLAQHRMATTEQMHLLIAPRVRIEQTRRRLVKLRGEGLIDRVTLPQADRTRVWFVTQHGAQAAAEWPELQGWPGAHYCLGQGAGSTGPTRAAARVCRPPHRRCWRRGHTVPPDSALARMD
ncbi:protein involved in plasmid replication-relaxation [Streptomyces sp. T12]|uniref:replication-relaxation family protein n=1 Tax=Streptomyces sp. T12 TaxID=477697 RepID=UPI00119DB28E|nr:replication-relaxation family protein [Streptomyces sp. T12]TWD13167.1 protein involved in plasmid replication-relaxation [Streptomyces sp. T12]